MHYKVNTLVIYLREARLLKGRVTYVSDYQADILWEKGFRSHHYPFSDWEFWKYVVVQCD